MKFDPLIRGPVNLPVQVVPPRGRPFFAECRPGKRRFFAKNLRQVYITTGPEEKLVLKARKNRMGAEGPRTEESGGSRRKSTGGIQGATKTSPEPTKKSNRRQTTKTPGG